MQDPSHPAGYEFGGFRLNLRRRLLFTGDDGRPVPLSPRAFETLVLLVECGGEMLDKSELLRKVWPNTVVEENSLNQCISQLRRALGERPGQHRFIATVPGRGYRFVADVTELAQSEQPDSKRGRTAAVDQPQPPARAALDGRTDPTAGPERSIAVLPFANLTGDTSKEYLCDGIAEELIHTLARIPGLKIPARTSSFAFKGRNIDVRQIARTLAVKSILEGSVRSAGERIRVTIQLVDAETGYHAWSRSFDRGFEHLFELQDELAREVARNLSLETEPAPQPPSNDLEAYLLLLQAVTLGQRIGNEQSVRAAIDLLERAVKRDPAFARAFAWLAMCYMSCVEMGYPVPDALAHAERAADEALNLDPGIADVHAMLGALCTLRGRWVECAARYETAMALSTDPIWRRWRALFLLQSAGQIRESVRQLEVELHDPELGMWTAVGLAIAHVLLNNDAKARGFADLALPSGHPHRTTPFNDLYAQLAIRSKRYDEAAEELAADVSRPMQVPGAKEAVRLMCAALAGSVEPRVAVAALRDFEDRLGPDGPDHATCKRLLLWYTMLGATDVAHDCATRCLDAFMRSGTVGSTWAVMWMPEMRPFRTDPRFEDFIARLGLVPYWEQYGPPDGYDLVRGKLVPRE